MRHCAPAEVVTLPVWMSEQGAAGVVTAEEPLQEDSWMTATRLPSHRKDDCRAWSRSIARTGSTDSPGCSRSPHPSCFLIHLANIYTAVCTTFVQVCSLDIISADERLFTAVKLRLWPGTAELQLENWKPSTCKPYWPSHDGLTVQTYRS